MRYLTLCVLAYSAVCMYVKVCDIYVFMYVDVCLEFCNVLVCERENSTLPSISATRFLLLPATSTPNPHLNLLFIFTIHPQPILPNSIYVRKCAHIYVSTCAYTKTCVCVGFADVFVKSKLRLFCVYL